MDGFEEGEGLGVGEEGGDAVVEGRRANEGEEEEGAAYESEPEEEGEGVVEEEVGLGARGGG